LNDLPPDWQLLRHWATMSGFPPAAANVGRKSSCASMLFGTVKTMKVVPFGMPSVVTLAVAAALPMLPLVAAVVPLPQLLGQLAKALL
jgi:hypothetical protein